MPISREEFSRLTGHLRGQRIARLTDTRLEHENKQVRVLQLINAYRFRGHQHARTDPLQHQQPEPIPELELDYHNLSEADFDTVFHTGSLVGPRESSLREILFALNRTYCETVGAEYMHITETAEKRWIQQRLEGVRSHPSLSKRKAPLATRPPDGARRASSDTCMRSMSVRSAFRWKAARA